MKVDGWYISIRDDKYIAWCKEFPSNEVIDKMRDENIKLRDKVKELSTDK